MRRFERRRVQRIERVASIVGLSFALGALADAALTWRAHRFDPVFETAAADIRGTGIQRALVPQPAPDPAPDLAPGSAPPWTPPWTGPETAPEFAPDPAGYAEGRVGVERVTQRGQPPPVATTGATAGVVALDAAVEMLRDRDLDLPVEGVDDDDLVDTFYDVRGSARAHEALDIMAPRHTPVLAVENGVIAKLYNSQGGGGITIYQFDPSRMFSYYYAHLDRYAPGLREGQTVRRGETIGYIGSTGNASPDAPHLHFAIFRLPPERQWWKGDPINPYPVLR